jgi:hypothetical protein
VDNRTTNCGGNQMVKGFNGGAINCQNAVAVNQTCTGGQLFTGLIPMELKFAVMLTTFLVAMLIQKLQMLLLMQQPTPLATQKVAGLIKDLGGRGVCRYNLGCFMSSYQGCYSCPSNIHYNCGSGWSEAAGGSCGTWGSLCEGYCNRNGIKACWCSLSNDGKSCGGDNCAGCSLKLWNNLAE